MIVDVNVCDFVTIDENEVFAKKFLTIDENVFDLINCNILTQRLFVR